MYCVLRAASVNLPHDTEPKSGNFMRVANDTHKTFTTAANIFLSITAGQGKLCVNREERLFEFQISAIL